MERHSLHISHGNSRSDNATGTQRWAKRTHNSLQKLVMSSCTDCRMECQIRNNVILARSNNILHMLATVLYESQLFGGTTCCRESGSKGFEHEADFTYFQEK